MWPGAWVMWYSPFQRNRNLSWALRSKRKTKLSGLPLDWWVNVRSRVKSIKKTSSLCYLSIPLNQRAHLGKISNLITKKIRKMLISCNLMTEQLLWRSNSPKSKRNMLAHLFTKLIKRSIRSCKKQNKKYRVKIQDWI